MQFEYFVYIFILSLWVDLKKINLLKGKLGLRSLFVEYCVCGKGLKLKFWSPETMLI